MVTKINRDISPDEHLKNAEIRLNRAKRDFKYNDYGGVVSS